MRQHSTHFRVLLQLAVGFSTLWTTTVSAGELEDRLLKSALQRTDVQGVEIALAKGANAREPIETGSGSLRSPIGTIRLALGGLADRDDPQAAQKVERIVRLLLSKGAKLTGHEYELYFPISYDHPRVLSLLLANGANPHDRILGYLPSELALWYGNEGLLPILRAWGAPVVPSEVRQQIRFVRAASQQDKSAMKSALAAGADVNTADPAGRYAIVRVFSMPLLEPDGYESVKFLLFDAKADVSVGELGQKATTALHKAVEMNSFRTIDQFTAAGILALLLNGGAKVSEVDYLGRTALHYAAQAGNLHAVEVLLAGGAKVSPKDKLGSRPFDLAKSGRVIETLRQHGARE